MIKCLCLGIQLVACLDEQPSCPSLTTDTRGRYAEMGGIKKKKKRMSGRSDGDKSSAERFAFFLQSVILFCVLPTMSGEREHYPQTTHL